MSAHAGTPATVVLCGWTAPPPPRLPGHCLDATPEEFATALVRRPEPAVVVLGADALHRLDPRRLSALRHGHSTTVLAVHGGGDPAPIEAWRRAAGLAFVEPHDMGPAVAAATRDPTRAYVAAIRWMRDPTSDPAVAQRILDALHCAPQMKPGPVAYTLGESEFLLDRSCIEHFGLCLGALCWRYIVFQTCIERERGTKLDDLPPILGLESRRTLERRFALRRARIPAAGTPSCLANGTCLSGRICRRFAK